MSRLEFILDQKMYNNRLKILIILFACFLSVGICRLIYLQVGIRDTTIEKIERTGIKPPEIIPTLRGSIIDRNGTILAIDTPQFYISIQYDMARLRDARFWESNALIRSSTKEGVSVNDARKYWEKFFASRIELLDVTISAASEFSGIAAQDIEKQIAEINERMWRMRRYFAWKRNFPLSEDITDYNSLDDNRRLMLEGYVKDLTEMTSDWYMLVPVLPNRLYETQNFFRDVDQVQIIPRATRKYPYDSTASQIIGWVNPKRRDNEIFEDDELLKYQPQELAGYQGVEYVCEPLLRGRRGKLVYEKRDSDPTEEPREFGQDVKLTLDIDLQQKIENMLLDPDVNTNYAANCAAVVIDVPTGEVLASVSLPGFDLNTVRRDFSELANNPRRPLENKTMQSIYPPGSTIKPIILAAGLQEGNIRPQESISCPLPAEEGWPRCWLQRKYGCHDDQFADIGDNNAVNATKGSCNIYFTKLANRLNARKLQKWLYEFGYGRKILQEPDFTLSLADIDTDKFESRNIREHGGYISNKLQQNAVDHFDNIPPMADGERRWFGMGQGNLRVTVLQVANSFATLARGGVYVQPKLYLNCGVESKPVDLKLSASTNKTIKDGLFAVVNKYHGTAYEVFKDSNFKKQSIDVFGKTGSTERPDNAWFAGYAKDSGGRCLAIALVIEQGQSGSHDASPLAKEIFNICRDFGYLNPKED